MLSPANSGTGLGLRGPMIMAWWSPPAAVTPAQQANPSEITEQPGAKAALAQSVRALRVKPGTGDPLGVERTALGIQGNRRDKRDLVFGAPAGFAADPFAAPIGVVHPHLTAQGVLGIEPPRELRRLHYLREWSHEQDEPPRELRRCV